MRAEGPIDDQECPLDQTPLSVLFLDDNAGKISRMFLSLAQRLNDVSEGDFAAYEAQMGARAVKIDRVDLRTCGAQISLSFLK